MTELPIWVNPGEIQMIPWTKYKSMALALVSFRKPSTKFAICFCRILHKDIEPPSNVNGGSINMIKFFRN
ncbi:hypothetical protein GCM10023197_45400 [Gordonia humi]